jgi:hypothetical protein
VKRSFALAMLMTSMCMVGVAQTSMTPQMQNAPARKSPLADYAGAWIGTFEGHTWLSVRLTLQANQISGTLQRPKDFQFADNGAIKSVSDERLTEGVENAVVQGDGLLLTVKDPGTQQPDHYVMKITAPGMAELKMVAMSMPPGMPKPQPWKLSKVTPSAMTPVR